MHGVGLIISARYAESLDVFDAGRNKEKTDDGEELAAPCQRTALFHPTVWSVALGNETLAGLATGDRQSITRQILVLVYRHPDKKPGF